MSCISFSNIIEAVYVVLKIAVGLSEMLHSNLT